MGRVARLCSTLALVALGAAPAALMPRAAPAPPLPSAAPGTVEVRVAGVVAGGKEQGTTAVLLSPVEAGVDLVIPVLVSRDEASAVSTRLHHQSTPASEPAAQLADTIRELGAILERVEIDDLAPLATRGRLELRQQGRRLEVRARGADSIALALDAGVPLLVPRALLGQGRALPDVGELEAQQPREPAGASGGVHL